MKKTKSKTKKFKPDCSDAPVIEGLEGVDHDLYIHTIPAKKNVVTKVVGLEGTGLEKYFNTPKNLPANIILDVATFRLWFTPKQAKKIGEYLIKEAKKLE
jgi:hypothetical protein